MTRYEIAVLAAGFCIGFGYFGAKLYPLVGIVGWVLLAYGVLGPHAKPRRWLRRLRRFRR